VFSNGKAHGLIPHGHPLCGRGFGTLAAASQAAGAPADAILILGARLGLFTGGRGGGFLPPNARVIQVDVAGEEIGRNREIQLGIAADCREAVRALDAAASGRRWPERGEWLAAVHAARDAHRRLFAQALGAEKAPIHPYRLAHAIAEALPDDAIVCADGGETASWMEMAARTRAGGRWLSHGYLGCLGTGMPFAIAAQVAHPQQRVLCIVGDGSVGLNFAEFDTMVRHGLPIVTVVNNDQQWGMSAHGQDLIYGPGKRMVTQLSPTRYDLAAAGFGCHAEHVVEPRDLGPALRRALDSGRPACVNVMTDPSVIAPVTLAMVGGPRPQSTPAKGSEPEKIQIPYYDDLDS
jgi:acetolactate synthase-1/2/3 large subunit